MGTDSRRMTPAPQTAENAIVLNDFCYVQGGASKVAIDEAIALSHAGMAVTMIAAVGTPCEALCDACVKVVTLGQSELLQVARHPSTALRSAWNAAAFATTRALLERCDPGRTIVHLHGYTKALSTSPMLAARQAGFARVCTLHDFFAACPNGAFYDYQREQPCLRRALSPSCIVANCDKRHPAHKAYRVARGLVQRHYAKFPDSVSDFISLSNRSADILRPYLPAGSALYAVPNMIDTPRLPPVAVAANHPLLVLGRLDAEKGVIIAADAARQADVPLVFAGDGPLRQRLEALGATVTGWLDARGVQHWLEQARCLVFPSLWYETFGLVVEEAAARGVPAIVSDVCAAAERVRHGQTGWIFPSGDREALAGWMRQVQDDVRVADAGRTAYTQFWQAPPDRKRHVDTLMTVYQAVLERERVVGKTHGMVAS